MSYNREYYLKNKEKYLEATKRYIAKKRAEKNEEWLSERNEYLHFVFLFESPFQFSLLYLIYVKILL